MKKLALIAMAAVLFMACQQKDKGNRVSGDTKVPGIDVTDTTKWTEVEWVNDTFDFGKINEGPKVNLTYRVKNIGKQPLVIANVEKTCGCTETMKPEKPIMPGETGVIEAVYNSEGHPGVAHKSIIAVYNGKDSPKSLAFTGEVIQKSKQ